MLYKKKLAAYVRLSIEDGDVLEASNKIESNSISSQRGLIMDYYENSSGLKEYEIEVFCDDGYTGTNFNRPAFQKMMEDIKMGRIHAVIVKDLSRFGRDYLEVGAYLELIFPLSGTRFISINDGFDSNEYIGSTGGLEIALRNLINGMYSRDLSVKSRSAIATRNRQGKYWGGFAFYGYILDPEDKHRILVDEEVRSVVQRIFYECISGYSTAEIAKRLNSDGIPSPAARKKMKGQKYNGRIVESKSVWIPATIRKILNDERYTGKMISGTRESVGINTKKFRTLPKEEWIVVEGTHESIVSQECFDAAKTALKSRIRTVNKNTSGDRANNLFVCGYCGRKLQSSPAKIVHLYCGKSRTVIDAVCGGLHEDYEQLKSAVLKILRFFAKILMDEVVLQNATIRESIPKLKKQIKELEYRIQQLENSKLDLYEDYRNDNISRERFIELQSERQEENDKLQHLRNGCEKELQEFISKDQHLSEAISSAQEIQALSEYNPKVIRKLVKKIHVYENGKIEIELLSNDDFIVESLGKAMKMVS